MDKFYFDGAECGVPKKLRREYSQLTNTVLNYLDSGREIEVVCEPLNQIILMQSLDYSDDSKTIIKGQLRLCSRFWEDSRYELCWPVIDQAFDKLR